MPRVTPPPRRPRRSRRSRAAFALTAVLLAPGAAHAQGAPTNHVQLRFFAPSGGQGGLALDGQYHLRSPDFGVQFRVPELSTRAQNLGVAATWRALYAFGSLNADAERGTATLTAVVGYASPTPGRLTDASLTLVRASDAHPERGYALSGLALDLRGELAPEWRWNAGAALDETRLNAAPDEPDGQAAFTLGAQGKLGEVELHARARLAQPLRAPDEPRWTAALDAALPLTATERVEAGVELDRTSGDRERLALTTSRLKGLSLTAAVTRDPSFLGARLSATAAPGEALALSGEYGAALAGGVVTHDAAFGVEWRADGWSVTAALAGDLTPGADGGPRGALAARGVVQYRAGAWDLAAQGQVRLAPAEKDPWSFHADLNARTKTGAFSFVLSGRLDSAAAGRPLAGEAALQVLYDLAPNVALNATGRARTGPASPAAQFGLGVRYAF